MLTALRNIFRLTLENACSFPCPSCHDLVSEEGKNRFCPDCMGKINFVSSPFCPGCGGSLDGALELCGKCLLEDKRPWKKAVALFNMEGHGRILLHRLKYHNCPELARPFGELSAAALRKAELNPDFITPTPLHWTRRFRRGFNQAEILSGIISEASGIPMEKVLKRVKRTQIQSKLKRDERKKNLIGAFSAKKEEICKNKSILLVDDVMTTGATLAAATGALLDAGAKEVFVFALARR
jgi:ComF family protein